MNIQFLNIQNLRNISQIEFTPCSSINWIIGSNGAGKTSILEAIYLLGRGFSFRGNRRIPLVKNDQQYLLVYSQFKHLDAVRKLAIQKNPVLTKLKLDSEFIHNIDDLIQVFPLSIITPQSHDLLHRGPSYRRKFLDWAVFHVEHDYKNKMKNFKRILNQRNQALKKNDQTLSSWDKALIESSNLINDDRQKYFEEYLSVFVKIQKELMPSQYVHIEFNQGWQQSVQFERILESDIEKDRYRKFTHSGPHKADITFTENSKNIIPHLSRGQQKMLIFCLYFTQMILFTQKSLHPPVLLIDDLPSELDNKNKNYILNFIRSQQYQTFISSIDYPSNLIKNDEKVFHVEHGLILD